MKTIMLVCSSGMSTSMLVQRMKQSALNRSLNVEIFATSLGDADNQVSNKSIDLLLLGPQVRYMEKDFQSKYESSFPVSSIDPQAYGTMNGEKVLDEALELIEK